MSNIASGAGTVAGSADAEIIVGLAGASALAQTINAGGGNDVVIGDHGPTFVDNGGLNTSIAGATSINQANYWTTGFNPLVGDDSIPYTTILGTGAGAEDYFAVTLAAGATITVDVDFGDGLDGVPSFNSLLNLLDGAGNVLATADNASYLAGGLGAFGGYQTDSLVTFTVATAGTYYIELRAAFSEPGIPTDAHYLLGVSASGHAATANVALSGDTINGEGGDDYLIGNLLGDTIDGGDNNDLLYGFDGNDTLRGGTGDDVLHPGRGNDVIAGDSGSDTIDYSDVSAGVILSLAITTAQSIGKLGTATVTGIESIVGSDYADRLTGNTIANNFRPGLGNDQVFGGDGDDLLTIQPGSGGDTFDGGDDVDTVRLIGAYQGAGWTFNMMTGIGGDGLGNTLRVSNVEILIGTSNDDVFTSALGASINGGDGDDLIYAVLGIPETLDGGFGNDTLDTTAFNALNVPYSINLQTGATSSSGESFVNFDNLVSGNTADNVTGSSGANVIRTGGGNDRINGAGGADTIEAGIGTNSIDGGDTGTNFASYEHAATGVKVSLAITGAQSTNISTDTITNIDGLIGSAFADTLTGNEDDNDFRAGRGNDTLTGGDGDDVFFWSEGDGSDTIDGGGEDEEGDRIDLGDATSGWTIDLIAQTATNGHGDTLTLGNIENAFGSEFSDVIHAAAGPTYVNGEGGDDLIFASGQQNEVASGWTGVDTIDVTAGFGAGQVNTVNLATGMADYGRRFGNFENLVAGQSADAITGSMLANIISTGAGNDNIDGGDGDDTLDGGKGNDALTGGDGIDTASYADASAGVVVSLAKSGAQNTLGAGKDTLSGVENLAGSAFTDTLIGDNGKNLLAGAAGVDTLSGGKGNDVLLGGAGKDMLTGGLGADRFAFLAGDTADRANAADTIADFSAAQKDRIDLSAIDAITASAPVNRFAFIGTTGFSGTAGELRYVFNGADTLVTADTNGDATADLVIRLTGHVALVAKDFVGTRATNAFALGDELTLDETVSFHTQPGAQLAPMVCLV